MTVAKCLSRHHSLGPKSPTAIRPISRCSRYLSVSSSTATPKATSVKATDDGARESGAKAPRTKARLIVVASSPDRGAALPGSNAGSSRTPKPSLLLAVDDALIDSMRGRSSNWTRIQRSPVLDERCLDLSDSGRFPLRWFLGHPARPRSGTNSHQASSSVVST